MSANSWGITGEKVIQQVSWKAINKNRMYDYSRFHWRQISKVSQSPRTNIRLELCDQSGGTWLTHSEDVNFIPDHDASACLAPTP